MIKYTIWQFIKDWLKGFLMLSAFIAFVLFLIWLVTYFPPETFTVFFKWMFIILAVIFIPWLIGFKPERFI